jgi:hypothetical protein
LIPPPNKIATESVRNFLRDFTYTVDIERLLYLIIIIVQIILERLRLVPNALRQRLVSLNLFEGQGPHTPTSVLRERIATRLFMLLLIVGSTAFVIYSFFSVTNRIVTVTQPPLASYEQLYRDHADTLQCPCSQLSVPNGAFLNVTFILQQVCSSELVSTEWLNYVASFDSTLLLGPTDALFNRDFRRAGASYFQLLAIFCSLATTIIDDAHHVFATDQFVNDRMLPPPLFNQQTQNLIEIFINTTRSDFVRTLEWLRIAAAVEQLLTGTNMNSRIRVDDNGNVNILDVVLSYNMVVTDGLPGASQLCFCRGSGQICRASSALYFNRSDGVLVPKTFIGFWIGCVPLFGLEKSTIVWWYNRSYIQQIRSTYAMGIDSKYPPPAIEPLNPNKSTRFLNSTSGDLLNEMLIETLISNNSHFDRFYAQCAPISCVYSIVQRRDIVIAFLLIIAVCGGFKDVLELVVPIIVNLTFFGIEKWRNRNRLLRK